MMPTVATTPPPVTATAPVAGELRRYAMVAAVVGAWMLLGFALHTDGNTYLLLGVPLLWLFQRLVARRPVAELWFAQPGAFALPWWGWLLAAGFMVLPVRNLLVWHDAGWATRLWLACAALGAVPLAWSLARGTRAQWRELALCLALAGSVGVLTVLLSFLLRTPSDRTLADRVIEGLRSFILYLPVCFMLEEVFFRGGLDSYLVRGGTRAPWLSATFLSAVWGWWHLPIVHLGTEHRVAQLVTLFISLPLIHCGVGVFLSIFWRRSGLLLVPVAAHAFIDAVRNALQ